MAWSRVCASALPLALALTHWAANAGSTADCRFVAEGETFIDGPCEFTPSGGGSFRIAADGYLVELGVLGREADGAWNGPMREGRLHESLHREGLLKRQGACWQGPAALLCVWAGNGRPGPKPAPLPRREAQPYLVQGKDSVGDWALSQVRRGGQLAHCQAEVLGAGQHQQGPLRMLAPASGPWLLDLPAAGRAAGQPAELELGLGAQKLKLVGRVDAVGQRVRAEAPPALLEGLAAQTRLLTGGEPAYAIAGAGPAFAALRRCASGLR